MRVLTEDDIYVGADILNERLYVLPNSSEEKELYTRPLVPVSVLREINNSITEGEIDTFSEFIQGLGLPSSVYGEADDEGGGMWSNGQLYALLKDLRNNLVFNREKAFEVLK